MASIEERPDRPLPYTVRWRELGKQRRESYRTKSEARAAKARKDVLEDQQRRGEYRPPAKPTTVAEEAEAWLRLKADSGSSAHYVASLRSVLDVWVLPHLGSMRVDRVGPGHLEDLLAAVSKSGRGNDTRVRVKGAVVGILDHAVDRNRLGQHQLSRVTAGAPKRQRPVTPYTDKQVEALKASMSRSDALAVDMMATMGLRPSEALSLRTSDVVEAELVVDAGKTGERRVLPLPAGLRGRLAAYVEESELGARLFPAPRGGAWTADLWRKRVFAPAAAAAGLSGRPYDLRHTCASKLIAKGATPADVAEWMGHSIKMTLQVYSHLFPGRKQELARLLE